MRESTTRRILSYFKVLSAAVWVIFLIIFLIQIQTKRFYDSLYIYTNLLITQQVFLVTIKRIILMVSLLAFGMACIFLYIISYETEEFLLYTRIFWYAAGFIASEWDYQAIFYVARDYSRFCRTDGDICLVLLFYTVFQAIVHQLNIDAGKILERVNDMLSVLSLAIFILGNLYQTKLYLKFYFCSMAVLFAVILYLYLKTGFRQKRMNLTNLAEHILTCLLVIVPVVIAFVTANYKYNTLSGGYEFYFNALPIVVLFYTILLFVRFFQYHRTGFLVGSNVNRKIAEITRHKEALTKLILSRCIVPVNNLFFYSRMLHEENELSKDNDEYTIIQNMELEIDRLKESLDNIENFHYLFGRDTHGEKIKVNIAAVVHYIFYLLENEGGSHDFQMIWNDVTDRDFIWGDPSMLIQANRTLLAALTDIQVKNSGVFQLKKSDNEKIKITIICQLEDENIRMAKRIRQILNSPIYTRPMMTDTELSLYVAKGNIRTHSRNLECRIFKKDQKLKVQIQYELSCWNNKDKDEDEDYTGIQDSENHNAKKIILLSTAPEQIEIIRSYLMFEDYKVLIFHTEEDALKYIEKGRNIGAIIIGTIFSSMYVNRFCKNVREYYSLGQLPILIVCRDKYKYVNQELLKYVNDIITEPFAQIDLQRKLQLLLMLQNSAQETARAKLDFLQAQMDPHFIFNTISTIMPLCIQNPMQAYEMLNDFSLYLRGRLYTNDLQESFPISRELELIRAYLSIEKVRFSEYLEYEINVQASEEIAVLPLLIEPIVENSVKHGINGRKKLKIKIDIVDIGDSISISVEDNGRGMTAEKLNQIMEQESDKSGMSIGVQNVRKRLSIYYNQKLVMKSIPDIGTKTFFKIPKYYLM